MKLAVKIEPQWEGHLHYTLVDRLEQAAKESTLDNALKVLNTYLYAEGWWLTGRGGHHVFLCKQDVWTRDSTRVAMIVEVA